ncbi:hypothetical protein BC832DRAFT_527154 [Gaertneriomyces semiglobifer]|nr:hypothetical protein BC832DRAFT_527154 [Gaertneriomyces semiglobifer]
MGSGELVLHSPTSAQALLHHNHPPLLNKKVAAVVSKVSSAARVSLRLTSIMVEAVCESLKFSASTSLGITRRAMVTAISSARTLHLLAIGRGKSDSVSFFRVLDKYTLAGVYVVHNVFSLAELLTHTTFHLASSTIRFSLNAAEECVQVLDGLFGETETSKALAAFVCLVKKELEGTEDDVAISSTYGRVSALGQITKALTAYCCLQYLNRRRWRKSLKLATVFEGHVHVRKLPNEDQTRAMSTERYGSSNIDRAGLASVASITVHSSQHSPQPSQCASPRIPFMDALDARRMSNPERLSWLGRRHPDVDHGSGPPYPVVREDSGFVDGDCWERGASSEFIGRSRHGSVTPGSGRRRTRSGQSAPQHLDHAQVVKVLRMLESVKIGRDFDNVLPSPKWESQSPVSKPVSPKHTERPTSLGPLVVHDVPQSSQGAKFEKISRYVRFASGAYGTNFLKILGIGKARDLLIENCQEHHNHQSFAFHTNLSVEHIISSSFRNPSALHPPALIAPVHYVAVDAHTKAVVVSLRGTLGFSDLITDLTSNYAAYTTPDGHEGKVHAGMLASAEKIATGPVRDAVIDALNKHPTFSLVLTGHSLGGGVAALLALIWCKQVINESGEVEFFTNTERDLPHRPLHCYVYGSPAVMTLDLSSEYMDLITTVIYRHDVVPCLSLGLIRDFRNVAVNLCNEKGLAERVIGKVLGVFKNYPTGMTGAEHEDELWYWGLLKTLRADMRAEKLYPPGCVYWLDATTPIADASIGPLASEPCDMEASRANMPTALTVHRVDDVEVAFSEFTFSRTMFIDQ